jgi:hypothetical protein
VANERGVVMARSIALTLLAYVEEPTLQLSDVVVLIT